MIGGTGSYTELLLIMICWVILNPIFITIYFRERIIKRFNSRIKKRIVLFLFYFLIVFIAGLSVRLIDVIKLIPFLITSLISTIILVFMVDHKEINK
ncbi:membrane protein of unknown function [Tenacibaculum sp. 190524A02b]